MKIIDDAFQGTMHGLQKALDLTYQRNNAISSNIANAETPQYRAVDLDFGGELERAFGNDPTQVLRTNEKHLDVQQHDSSHVVEDLRGATKPDGNNVDIDIEMGQLAYNSTKYTNAVRYLRKQLGMLRYAIRTAGQ